MDTKLSWNDAEQECQSFGGNLASIPNEATNNFLNNLGDKQSFKWIGGYDFNTGGEWKWSDGTPWSYTKWGKNYPKNSKGKDYLSMFGDDGIWGDYFEVGLLEFICQYKPTNTATSITTASTTTATTTTTSGKNVQS